MASSPIPLHARRLGQGQWPGGMAYCACKHTQSDTSLAGTFFAFIRSPFKEKFWLRPERSDQELWKKARTAHLFESETNYGIKESGEKPVIQLINPHLLTETVVGPSQHGCRTVTQILIPRPSMTAGAQAEAAQL